MRNRRGWLETAWTVLSFVFLTVVSALGLLFMIAGYVMFGIARGVVFGIMDGSKKFWDVLGDWKVNERVRILAAMLAVFVFIILMVQYHNGSKVIGPIKEPQEPKGIGALIPHQPKLNFSNAERRKLIDQYGQDSLEGLLLVIDPGHGAQANALYGLDPGTHWIFDREGYWEASYTFRMARELGLMAESLGATVEYCATAWSMDEVCGPKDPLPMPKNATAYGGTALHSVGNTTRRAQLAGKIAGEYAGRCSRSAFISLHIDAIGSVGWSGLRVWHRRDNKPAIATLIEKALIGQGYGRKRFGEAKSAIGAKTWNVLGGYNTIENKVLLECGVPNDDKNIAAQAKDPRWRGLSAAEQRRFLGGDSWRLRNPENRRLMLERVVIGPLVELNKGGG